MYEGQKPIQFLITRTAATGGELCPQFVDSANRQQTARNDARDVLITSRGGSLGLPVIGRVIPQDCLRKKITGSQQLLRDPWVEVGQPRVAHGCVQQELPVCLPVEAASSPSR
ncbi:MAG: hypothetical protein QOF56_2758 [Acidobacteriaceae bacterium]|jgi:hypothetical protein|nr:hypothetical protein [Acidobacteriaceae bacterium]